MSGPTIFDCDTHYHVFRDPSDPAYGTDPDGVTFHTRAKAEAALATLDAERAARQPIPDSDDLADAATILGIVLSTSVMTDKHPEECIEAAKPMLAHLAALGWHLAAHAALAATPKEPANG